MLNELEKSIQLNYSADSNEPGHSITISVSELNGELTVTKFPKKWSALIRVTLRPWTITMAMKNFFSSDLIFFRKDQS